MYDQCYSLLNVSLFVMSCNLQSYACLLSFWRLSGVCQKFAVAAAHAAAYYMYYRYYTSVKSGTRTHTLKKIVEQD